MATPPQHQGVFTLLNSTLYVANVQEQSQREYRDFIDIIRQVQDCYPFSLACVHDKKIRSGRPSVWTEENLEDMRVRMQVSPRKSRTKLHPCPYVIGATTCTTARLFGEVCALLRGG
jgi:hypothetical protein